MKRIKLTLLIIFIIAILPRTVFASPNASLKVSATSIENGKSVTATVTLTDTAAWNIKIQGSGAASCSSKQADVTSNGKSTTKSFSLACKATTEGIIDFKVTGDITSGKAETRDISLSKAVTVTKAKSSDNTLKELKVDGTNVSGFSGSKTSYNVGNKSGTSINISASANDSKAKVNGTGTKTLNYGSNTFKVEVVAENGSKKTYTITVNKPDSRSNNNYLKSLSVDKGNISFDKNNTSYTIKLEHSVNELTIKAVAEDSKATVSGTGVKQLSDYVNEFKIVVKAENESTKTYIIKVIRKDADGNYGKLSEDNSVKNISIKDCDFSFKKEVKKYNIVVENIIDLEINVEPNDSSATISIENNKNLKSGLNKVTVKVVAENGNENEYLFNVYKIGEEETTVVPTQPEQNKMENNNNNIYLITSIVELVIILILLLLLLLNNKKSDSINKTGEI